jgi:hypothetical protein
MPTRLTNATSEYKKEYCHQNSEIWIIEYFINKTDLTTDMKILCNLNEN